MLDLRSIDEIYEAVVDDAAYARIPEVLCRATGARSSIMIDVDEQLRSQSWVDHQVSDTILSRYAELDLWQHDVWTRLMARPGYRNRAVVSCEVIDVESFRGSVFYNELYRPLGDDTARCLGVVLDRPGGALAIGLHRAYGQPAYGRTEAAILQQLAPHIRRLLVARNRLAVADRQAQLLSTAVDALPSGLLLLDPDGRLIFANRRGEDLLRQDTGLRSVRGRVVPADPSMTDRFAEAVRSAAMATASRGGAMRLPRDEHASLVAFVVPLSGAMPGALVIVDDETLEQSVMDTLKNLFGLTSAEAAVADLLARGLTTDEIAMARNVRVSTVRTQIKSLLAKADAGGLIDFARIASRASVWATSPSPK